MKPVLVIGLGNPLMGDEGIGCHVAERLACDPRLPEGVEVIAGGTDLLRHAGAMEGRERVVVVDAVCDGGEAGRVSVYRELDELEDRQEHAHHLSAAQGLKLLRMMMSARFVLVGVSIEAAEVGALSAGLAARVPGVVTEVVGVVGAR